MSVKREMIDALYFDKQELVERLRKLQEERDKCRAAPLINSEDAARKEGIRLGEFNENWGQTEQRIHAVNALIDLYWKVHGE